MVQPHRQQLTNQYGAEKVRFACRVTKARTQKHTLYLVLLVFPWQQWLRERASMLRFTYRHCLSCLMLGKDMTGSAVAIDCSTTPAIVGCEQHHTAVRSRIDLIGHYVHTLFVFWQVPTVIFFFLLWLYNSVCIVLAFSTNSFHLLLSWTRVFQFGTFDFCVSFLTSSSQRVFGLPVGLLEMGFQDYIALTIPQ